MKSSFEVIVIEGIEMELARKSVRRVRISVHAPDGRVRVSAPASLPLIAVRQTVRGHIDWIRTKQVTFSRRGGALPVCFITGEKVTYRGEPFPLHVFEGYKRESVLVNGEGEIELHVKNGSTPETREALLDVWYRKKLKEEIPSLILKWEKQMGVRVSEWGVKKMRTRWGTCNAEARRIWLSLSLAKKSGACLEYVVVHEMAHLLERGHGEKFKRIMDLHLPVWRDLRKALR